MEVGSKLWTVVSTYLKEPLILSPNFRSCRAEPCLLPSGYPFYGGESWQGWFSPGPADASALSLSLTLPPWEAPPAS